MRAEAQSGLYVAGAFGGVPSATWEEPARPRPNFDAAFVYNRLNLEDPAREAMSRRPSATPRQLCLKESRGVLLLTRPQLRANDRSDLFARAPTVGPPSAANDGETEEEELIDEGRRPTKTIRTATSAAHVSGGGAHRGRSRVNLH